MVKEKIKELLLTSKSPDKLNRMISIVIMAASAIMLLLSLFFVSVFEISAPSFAPLYDKPLPAMNFVLRNHFTLLSLIILFLIWGIFCGERLFKRSSTGYYQFLFLNGLFIILNISFIFFGIALNRDFITLGNILDLASSKTDSMITYLNFSYYFQGIFISLIHVWLIWRYWQHDIKDLFFHSG